MEGVLSKSTDDAKLGTMVDAPRNRVAVWTDLNRQEKWADKILRQFKDECKDLSLLWNNPTQRDTLSNGSKTALQSKTRVSWGQAEHDTATCPHGKGSQPNPGLYEQECTQQVGNDDYSPIFSTVKLHLGAPYSALGFPGQERHWHTEQVQQSSRSLKYVTHQERLRSRFVQPSEKTKEGSDRCLQSAHGQGQGRGQTLLGGAQQTDERQQVTNGKKRNSN